MGDADFALAADTCFLHQVYGHPLLADLFHWAVFVKLYQVDSCLIINCMSISSPLIKLLVLILCFNGIVTLLGNWTRSLLTYSLAHSVQ